MKILLRIVLAPVWLVCAVVKLASVGLRALSGWLFRGIGLLMLIVTTYCWYVQWADAGSLAYMLMGSLMFFFFPFILDAIGILADFVRRVIRIWTE